MVARITMPVKTRTLFYLLMRISFYLIRILVFPDVLHLNYINEKDIYYVVRNPFLAAYNGSSYR